MYKLHFDEKNSDTARCTYFYVGTFLSDSTPVYFSLEVWGESITQVPIMHEWQLYDKSAIVYAITTDGIHSLCDFFGNIAANVVVIELYSKDTWS